MLHLKVRPETILELSICFCSVLLGAKAAIESFKIQLAEKLKIKDMGEADMMLSIQISRESDQSIC